MRPHWLRWVRFWGLRESATSLGFLRVSMCASAVFALLSMADADLMETLWLPKAQSGITNLNLEHWLWAALGPPTPNALWSVLGLAVVGALLGLVGIAGRWPLLLTQQLYWALTSLNPWGRGGYDVLLCIALLVLFCSESHTTLSLACFRKHGTWFSAVRVPGWPRRLLLLQLVVMYAATGLQKIGMPWTPWGGYTALEVVFHDPTWTRWPPTWVGTFAPLLKLGTALSWHWEQTAMLMPLVLYFRRTRERGGRLRSWLNRWDLRLAWVTVGVTMHLGVLVFLDVGPFSWVTLSYYFTLWTGSELDAAFRRYSPTPRLSNLA
jgi:hypothetical protein